MKTRDMVQVGLFMAIVFLATAFLRIPSPAATGAGQVHTGTAVVFVISVVFGAKKGAIASLGMVLFNLTFGLALWAPINLIVRPIMALIFGGIANYGGAGGKNIWLNALAAVMGGLWLIPSMYVGQVLVFPIPWTYPVVGIPGNIAQIVLALALGLPMIRLVQISRPD